MMTSQHLSATLALIAQSEKRELTICMAIAEQAERRDVGAIRALVTKLDEEDETQLRLERRRADLVAHLTLYGDEEDA